MATLNLGRIKPVFRGAYDASTAYVVDDIVTSGNETFICILASTGNATSNATYWTKLAAKGTDGTDVGTTITTQGDILYRDGSGLQRLAKGTASQQLAMNSGATAPEWITASSGGILQVKSTAMLGTASITGNSSTWNTVSELQVDITPSSASNKVLVLCEVNLTGKDGYGTMIRLTRATNPIYVTSAPTSSQQTSSWATIIHGSGGGNMMHTIHKTFLDAPNTTSATTYGIDWLGEASENYYINRRWNDADNAYSGKATSSITVLEVASGAL